jgi:hypothetical protein
MDWIRLVACMVKRNHTSAAGSKVWHSLSHGLRIELDIWLVMIWGW